MGNGISLVALPWLVLKRTGNAVDASIVAGAATLPLLAATLIAGTAVDFLGRRRVAMLADALSGLSVAACTAVPAPMPEITSHADTVYRMPTPSTAM